MKSRVLGKIVGKEKGPLIILVGGLHGNERAGVKAIESIFSVLEERNIPIRGKIVGLSGNRLALKRDKRYVDYDLNRCWNADFITRLETTNAKENSGLAEDNEALELLQALKNEGTGDYTRKILVDLHTTSSEKGNFIVIPEDEARNEIVQSLKLPIIVDLDKYLDGTLMQYMHQKGYLAFAFEGGLMGSEEALSLHSAGIWELLKTCQAIEWHHIQDFTAYDKIVEYYTAGLPHMVSVIYRHWVKEEDHFKMRPGYHNFQSVVKGEVLASDKFGIIKARCDGLMFMPLYQTSGNEGFFIVSKV